MINILIVDDREDSRYLLESLLRSKCYNIHAALNGAEALDILDKYPVDLIISDILMPVMDGFQLCRKVRADGRFRHIPFMFYTATYTGPEDEAFAKAVGADRFVIKPCEPDLLLKIVEEIMAEGAASGSVQEERPQEDKEVFKLYSERLVRQLEQKMMELEKELQARRATETALEESRQRLIAAQNLARLGDFKWDIATGDVTWSPALYDLLGYEKSEIIDYARVDKEIHHPDDRAEISRWLQQCLQSGQEFHGPKEYRLVRKDGSEIDVQVLLRVKFESGHPREVFGTVQDVTERKKREKETEILRRQLYHAQKLESIGRLASGVAHDFNNVLSIIMGYGEKAIRRLDPSDPLRPDILEILKASERAATLTRQLLAFSRKQVVKLQALSLNNLIRNLEKMLRRLIGEDIELDLALSEKTPDIMADPGQIEQVVLNLVINARDAMPNGGRILVETTNAWVDEEGPGKQPGLRPGRYAALSISDTGCGMTEEIMSQIFEPFFTTKDEGKGTGLGLSTVYGIVNQLGGVIHVRSTPGLGSTFTIYLPSVEGESISAKGKEEKRWKAGGEHALVVEDEEDLRNLLKAALVDLGFRVTVAGNGEEALSLVDEMKVQPDILITDLVMPGMNGVALFERLKEIYPTIKVIFISGYADDIVARYGMHESGVFFLRKPLKLSDLAEKCEAALRPDVHKGWTGGLGPAHHGVRED